MQVQDRSAGPSARRRPSAPRSTTRQARRLWAMSEPWPPAFIRTPPPTEPGTPTAHSRPVRPASTRLAGQGRQGHGAPGLHRRPLDGDGAEAGRIEHAPRCPANPASATSRLDPRPTTSTGKPDWRRQPRPRPGPGRLAADRDHEWRRGRPPGRWSGPSGSARATRSTERGQASCRGHGGPLRRGLHHLASARSAATGAGRPRRVGGRAEEPLRQGGQVARAQGQAEVARAAGSRASSTAASSRVGT